MKVLVHHHMFQSLTGILYCRTPRCCHKIWERAECQPLLGYCVSWKLQPRRGSSMCVGLVCLKWNSPKLRAANIQRTGLLPILAVLTTRSLGIAVGRTARAALFWRVATEAVTSTTSTVWARCIVVASAIGESSRDERGIKVGPMMSISNCCLHELAQDRPQNACL